MEKLPSRPIYTGEIGPPQDELIECYLEAIHRKTRAFHDLKKGIDPTTGDADVKGWMHRWRLDEARLGNPILSERIESRIELVILPHLAATTGDGFEIDCGFWEDRGNFGLPEIPTNITAPKWRPDREDYSRYVARVRPQLRKKIERFLREQRIDGDQSVERFGMRQWLPRATKSNTEWRFEWLALSIQRGMKSAEMIETFPEYRRVRLTNTIDKAIQEAKNLLGIKSPRRAKRNNGQQEIAPLIPFADSPITGVGSRR